MKMIPTTTRTTVRRIEQFRQHLLTRQHLPGVGMRSAGNQIVRFDLHKKKFALHYSVIETGVVMDFNLTF